MPYQIVRDGSYPGTTLPVFKVYDAEEYEDSAVKHPRPIGEVWAAGVRGVLGQSVPTGVRWQLTGSQPEFTDSPELPVGAYAEAARLMIAEHEARFS